MVLHQLRKKQGFHGIPHRTSQICKLHVDSSKWTTTYPYNLIVHAAPSLSSVNCWDGHLRTFQLFSMVRFLVVFRRIIEVFYSSVFKIFNNTSLEKLWDKICAAAHHLQARNIMSGAWNLSFLLESKPRKQYDEKWPNDNDNRNAHFPYQYWFSLLDI